MRKSIYILFMFSSLNLFSTNVDANFHSKNYCQKLLNFLVEQSSQYSNPPKLIKCVKKSGSYYIYSNKTAEKPKKINQKAVNYFYRYQNEESKNHILEIIFKPGIK